MQAEQVTYIEFEDLTNPTPNSIEYELMEKGLESKEWKINFDTISTRFHNDSTFKASQSTL